MQVLSATGIKHCVTKGRVKFLVGSLDGKTSKPSTDFSRADSQASHPGSFHRGAPKEELPLLTHGLEHPQGSECKGAKQSRLGRGPFFISSARVADDRGSSAAPAQHTRGLCRAQVISNLQLHLPEQTQPRAIYSLLRYQQGQQPAHKPTNSKGGAVGNLEHFGIFTLFMFLCEHTLRLCHHIQ